MFVLLFVALVDDRDVNGLAAWPAHFTKNNFHTMAVHKL
jgi:hypothetical protein